MPDVACRVTFRLFITTTRHTTTMSSDDTTSAHQLLLYACPHFRLPYTRYYYYYYYFHIIEDTLLPLLLSDITPPCVLLMPGLPLFRAAHTSLTYDDIPFLHYSVCHITLNHTIFTIIIIIFILIIILLSPRFVTTYVAFVWCPWRFWAYFYYWRPDDIIHRASPLLLHWLSALFWFHYFAYYTIIIIIRFSNFHFTTEWLLLIIHMPTPAHCLHYYYYGYADILFIIIIITILPCPFIFDPLFHGRWRHFIIHRWCTPVHYFVYYYYRHHYYFFVSLFTIFRVHYFHY